MDGRKEKLKGLKSTLQICFYLLMLAGLIVSIVFTNKIFGQDSVFNQTISENAFLNMVYQALPKIIRTAQIIIGAVFVNLIIKYLSKLCFTFSARGKSIVNLLASLLKWLVVIASLFMILSFWGVNTITILASAGIITLVVGLGAQSLIADILAGIFIIIEGQFLVGDIVIIDSWRGKITNLGVRTMEIEDICGNIKVINNSEVKSVVNLTQKASLAICEIDVCADEKLAKIEEIINSNLEIIKNNIPAILEKPVYKGVNAVDRESFKIMITAKCYEEDLFQVERDLRREFIFLLENNNMCSFAEPVEIRKVIDLKTNTKN